MQISCTWMFEDKLLACAHPRSARGLQELATLGVSVLINLDRKMHGDAELVRFGIRQVHLPVRDFSPPSLPVLRLAVAEIAQSLDQNETIAVHCRGGLGRTGTVIAAWFVHQGMSAPEAISHVRMLRPHSIETSAQEDVIYRYAACQIDDRLLAKE